MVSSIVAPPVGRHGLSCIGSLNTIHWYANPCGVAVSCNIVTMVIVLNKFRIIISRDIVSQEREEVFEDGTTIDGDDVVVVGSNREGNVVGKNAAIVDVGAMVLVMFWLLLMMVVGVVGDKNERDGTFVVSLP
jgi:hypothetical protein